MEDNVSDTNCSAIPVATHGIVLAQQVTVSITCILSILGAILIIFTYFAFKDLRTGARQLLVQLSIADICVAASHMFGVIYNLPRYVHPCDTKPIEMAGLRDLPCEIQAGFTMFGVVSTFLWTLAMAVYLLVIIVFEQKVVGKRLRIIFYPICWGIPLVLIIVYSCLNFFGFDDSVDVGWCYMTWLHSNNTQHRPVLPGLFGYHIWVYLTYILLPLLYIWIRCYVRVKLTRVHSRTSIPTKLQSKSRLSDVKLTFIPLIFLLLRLSGVGLAIPHLYLSYERRLEFRATWWNAVMVLIAGVGSSAQGLMNAILFCAFTRVVRNKLIFSIQRVCRCKKWRDKSSKLYLLQRTPPPSQIEHEDTTDDEMDEQRVCAVEHSPVNLTKTRLLSGSDSVPQYHSINQVFPHGVE